MQELAKFVYSRQYRFEALPYHAVTTAYDRQGRPQRVVRGGVTSTLTCATGGLPRSEICNGPKWSVGYDDNLRLHYLTSRSTTPRTAAGCSG